MSQQILAIHDISCIGRCSLTVALPIISSAGIETSILPTAILSTHTGGFTDFTFRDLTQDMLPITKHWQSLDITFSGIYSGYLGSIEQIDIVKTIFQQFQKTANLICVDPVMGDAGVLYNNFSADFPKSMSKLCEVADIIIPNMTEAALLLEIPYKEPPYTAEYIEEILKKLAELGPKMVCLTGVSLSPKQTGAALYVKETTKTIYAFSEKISGFYHGTGDLFASSLFAMLINGIELETALTFAVQFTHACILRTKNAGTDERFGVHFEQELNQITEFFKK